MVTYLLYGTSTTFTSHGENCEKFSSISFSQQLTEVINCCEARISILQMTLCHIYYRIFQAPASNIGHSVCFQYVSKLLCFQRSYFITPEPQLTSRVLKKLQYCTYLTYIQDFRMQSPSTERHLAQYSRHSLNVGNPFTPAIQVLPKLIKSLVVLPRQSKSRNCLRYLSINFWNLIT